MMGNCTKIDKLINRSIQNFLSVLLKEGLNVNQAYLYGSYAKGKEHKWSDIDIAVISPDFSDTRLNERIKLMKIASEIDDRIEPVPYLPENFVDEDPLVWQIKKEGLLLNLN